MVGEIIWEDPLQRYGSGILYPSVASEHVDEFVEDDTEDDEAFHVNDGIAVADDVEIGASRNVTSTNMMKPSAFGLAFRTDSEELVVVVGGASYKSAAVDQGRRSWKRVPLREETVTITAGRPDPAVFDGRAKLVSRWRKSEEGVRTVTIAVTGAAYSATQGDRKVKAEDCLFQVSLRVQAPSGNFHETPPRPGVAGGLDERSLSAVSNSSNLAWTFLCCLLGGIRGRITCHRTLHNSHTSSRGLPMIRDQPMSRRVILHFSPSLTTGSWML